MSSRTFVVLLLCCTTSWFSVHAACPKSPFEGERQPGDNGYRLVFSEDITKYVPGRIYNLFLLGTGATTYNRFSVRAQAATGPAAAAAAHGAQLRAASPRRVGRFQLFSDVHTRFDEQCVNRVRESHDHNSNAARGRTETQLMWVAPKAGAGCVAISAAVWTSTATTAGVDANTVAVAGGGAVADEGRWYADEGQLMRVVCEATAADQAAEAARASGAAGECCACDEAKYNFVFEGIWSNETHPRDYPFAIWLTHFSDVIGATHGANFSFWGANHIATDGFRSLAEWGSIRLLETELRAKGSKLRTLFKAAGLWYPAVNTNTSSAFRVDRQHPRVSLVSMFGPSPDWVVGVSGMDLCRADCTWADEVDVDLLPWDAGTDNGISYMSPNSETQPRERMYPITTMYPEDPRQPFYDPVNRTMTPLARLYIRKVKQYPRACDAEFLQAQVLDVAENSEDDGPAKPECEVLAFGEWTPCSVTCGKGIRMRSRVYRDEALAKRAQCATQLINREMCVADVAECDPATAAAADSDGSDSGESADDNLARSAATVDERGEGVGVCRTQPWSEWSPCSATCGIGISMRTRTFVEHAGRKRCPHITVVEKEKCMRPECSAAEMELPDAECAVTLWSDWGPCSATVCGRGVRIRARQLLVEGEAARRCAAPGRKQLSEQQECWAPKRECAFDARAAREACAQPLEVGPCRGAYERWAWRAERAECARFMYGGCRGNGNNFVTAAECERACVQQEGATAAGSEVEVATTTAAPVPVDCALTEWSEWSRCSVSCGMGVAERSRRIVAEARNGGLACPTKLVKRRRCYQGSC